MASVTGAIHAQLHYSRRFSGLFTLLVMAVGILGNVPEFGLINLAKSPRLR